MNAGVPNVMLTLVRSLCDRVIFTLMALPGGTLDEEFKRCGVEIVYLRENRPTSKWKRRVYDYTYRYGNIANQLKSLLKKNRYDVIHCSAGFDGGLYMKAAAKCGIPVRILHCHGKFPQKAHSFLKRLQVSKYRKLIERYVNVKLSCSRAAGETYFLSTEDMITLVNPVDIATYEGIVKQESKKVRILQVGLFNENKNQLFSLCLVKALRDRGVLAELKFIGYELSSPYGQQMLDYVRANNLTDCVAFLNSDEDKRIVFATTDVLLLPSYTEACPLVALEAQAANIPVLTSDNVPADVNFGLCEFIPLEDREEWLDHLVNIKNKEFFRRTDFLELTPHKYGDKIYGLYIRDEKWKTSKK